MSNLPEPLDAEAVSKIHAMMERLSQLAYDQANTESVVTFEEEGLLEDPETAGFFWTSQDGFECEVVLRRARKREAPAR